MNQKKYYRSSELKQRGWTEGLIKKFLPKPDETKTNPVIKSAAPMKLYKIKRVERIEKSEKFIKEMESISMRKAAARKAVETKTAKTIEWANSVKFSVPKFNKDKLLKKAIYHYEQFHDTCVGSIDDEFAARISTNYIRHECTNYERVLGALGGKVGRAKAYEIIKEKVNQTIKNQHEWLKFDYHQ
jgi:hypothetical protein